MTLKRFIDGMPFEGGKAENYSLKMGSNQFIPGFEDQLIGRSTDEEFDVEVSFPEDYHAKELAGKPAVFKCKLHEIKTREFPELNDEFAKDVSEFDTLDELKTDLKAKLEHQREHAADDDFESQLIEQLIDGLKAEIPEAMFENRVNESVRNLSKDSSRRGLISNPICNTPVWITSPLEKASVNRPRNRLRFVSHLKNR